MISSALLLILGPQQVDPFTPTPLLNGFSPAELALNSLRCAAPECIYLVTDRPEQCTAHFVQQHGMDGVLHVPDAGIFAFAPSGCGDVLMLPVNTPFVQPETFRALLDAAADKSQLHVAAGGLSLVRGASTIALSGGQQQAAPLVEFPSGEQNGGQPLCLPVEDLGLRLSIDSPESLAALSVQLRQCGPIADRLCEQYYIEAKLACHIRAHCRAVGILAEEMALKLVRQGACLSPARCRSGGMLHDLCRLEPNHSAAGADFLQAKGHDTIAQIVRLHDGYSYTEHPQLDEAGIVCLADKLVQDRLRVTLEQRYRSVTDRFPEDTPVGQHIRENMAKCRLLLARYQSLIGEDLERQYRCHSALQLQIS